MSRETEKALMAQMPTLIAEFLRGKRVAVAGVSRGSGSAANPVYRKLRSCGYEVFPVNPTASEVEGAKCYRDLASIPGDLDSVVIATHPDVSAQTCGRPSTGKSVAFGFIDLLVTGVCRRRQYRNARERAFRASWEDAR